MIDTDKKYGRLDTAALAIVVLWCCATSAGAVADVRLSIGITAIVAAGICLAVFQPLFRGLFAVQPRGLALGMVAAALMTAATYILYPALSRAFPALGASTAQLYRLMKAPHVTPAVLAIVWAIVLGEEVLWRGVVQEALQRKLRPAWGISASAIVYGVCHAPIGSILLTVVAIACGAYWSTLRWYSRNLWPSLIAHLIWDAAILTHPLAGK